MGVIYPAHHTLLDRDVAQPALSGSSTAEGRLRLLREARTAGKDHGRIKIRECGTVSAAFHQASLRNASQRRPSHPPPARRRRVIHNRLARPAVQPE
jgi:hypothetical protein